MARFGATVLVFLEGLNGTFVYDRAWGRAGRKYLRQSANLSNFATPTLSFLG
jgi:hypothetical protein